ncbi:hypothetical protein [Sulfitobacter sp. S190]|uniref:hypothetical protein n=1 Tax=Sulfitobacter sp. S190 TaxID=2867022 RepID=UPI0021A59369|nr:hypothetical protein [Sulfitobacter sp. S190]UWR22293.1 hypothetical protein K3756_16750 [Sulfitobacter sp. S190]
MSNQQITPGENRPAFGRQLIVIAAALAVMAAGALTLLNMQAPYHPADFSDVPYDMDDEVSRDDAVLLNVSAGN